MARAAQLGLAKLRSYSCKIREIPVYLAAVVLDPRQKCYYFELGVEQGDWMEQEVIAAREIVELQWAGEYKQSDRQYLAHSLESVAQNQEVEICDVIDEAEEHHRQWQAKRRRITPGINL